MEGTMAPGCIFRYGIAPVLADRPPTRLRLRIIPTLIGVVAVLNVTSVVMALIE
jgi:hypothetical protein